MSRIRPARFVHVVYRTRRFDEMVQWYQTVLDAKVRLHRRLIEEINLSALEKLEFALGVLFLLVGGLLEDARRLGVAHLAGDLDGHIRNALRVSFSLLVPIIQSVGPALDGAVIRQHQPHVGAFEFLEQRIAVYRNGCLVSE